MTISKNLSRNAASLFVISLTILISSCSAGKNIGGEVVETVGRKATTKIAEPAADAAIKNSAAAISRLMKQAAADKGQIYVKEQLDNGYPVVRETLEDVIAETLIEELDKTGQQVIRSELKAEAVAIAAGILSSSEIEDDVDISPPEGSVSQTTQPKSIQSKATGWELMGNASTGESIYVDNSSINQSGTAISFTYQIGNETIFGEANCSANKWYASGYGEYAPQSQATQNMLNHVCSF